MAAHVASVRHLLRQPQASSDVTASSEREKQRGSLWEVSSDDSAVVVRPRHLSQVRGWDLEGLRLPDYLASIGANRTESCAR